MVIMFSTIAATTLPNTNGKPIKIGNYLIDATIGKGNSAVVKMATHEITQQKVNSQIYCSGFLKFQM